MLWFGIIGKVRADSQSIYTRVTSMCRFNEILSFVEQGRNAFNNKNVINVKRLNSNLFVSNLAVFDSHELF